MQYVLSELFHTLILQEFTPLLGDYFSNYYI